MTDQDENVQPDETAGRGLAGTWCPADPDLFGSYGPFDEMVPAPPDEIAE